MHRAREASRSRSKHRDPSIISDSDVLDDSTGLVEYKKGELIYRRYKIIGLAGQGTFGTVLNAYDQKRSELCAIKVVRAVRRYLEAAYVEIDILDTIRKSDKRNESLCVQMLKSMICYHGRLRHICIVFEPLGRSLYEFLKRNSYQGFSLENVRRFSLQILTAVSYCHSIDLIHTDLKLENVLFVEDSYEKVLRQGVTYRVPTSCDIRLIDFGGATQNHQHHARMINTRQYRAPEVMLCLGWSFPSDLQSCGCMLAELFTGELLFGTHEDEEHFALMQRIIGKKFDPALIDISIENCKKEAKKNRERNRKKSKRRGRSTSMPRADKIFSSDGDLLWPSIASSDESVRHVETCRTLKSLIPSANEDFVDLLEGLLELDPSKRLTADEALRHRFFDELQKRE